MVRTKTLATKLIFVLAWIAFFSSSSADAATSRAGGNLLSCNALATAPSKAPGSIAGIETKASSERAVPQSSLAVHIDDLLTQDFLVDSKISLSVVDIASGKTVYAKNPKQALNPASNIKLITTATALETLGPGHRFLTSVYIKNNTRNKQTISGDIYLQGGGDPLLSTGRLFELALEIRAQGITKVTGNVIVDSFRFDQDGLPPGFDQKEEVAHYRAPTGATSVNFNTYEVWVSPASTTDKSAVVQAIPPIPGIKLINKVTMIEGRRSNLIAEFETSKKRITVTMKGSLGINATTQQFRYPVDDPSRYAGEVFRMTLNRAGVRVQKRSIGKNRVPEDAVPIAKLKSRYLADIVRVINKRSNNFAAEQILRTLSEGPESTVQTSLDIVNNYVHSIGIKESGLRIGNGSGLYDTNSISAEHITTLLVHVYRDFRFRPDFLSSLPIMGIDGTTRNRLKDSPVAGWIRAKTGTLNGVSALSGYAGAAGKSPLAFSCLISGFKTWKIGRVRKIQNRIAESLALFQAGSPLTVEVNPAPKLAPTR